MLLASVAEQADLSLPKNIFFCDMAHARQPNSACEWSACFSDFSKVRTSSFLDCLVAFSFQK